MTQLLISLLGTFEVARNGTVVVNFGYDKVRALLAYLAVEADRPHRREGLASLLWPEHDERSASRSLSQALYKLRQAIGDRETNPPFLITSPQTLQFNASSEYNLDVTTFSSLLATCNTHDHPSLESCDSCLNRLQWAIALYRGSLLEGFSLGDSLAFEEWAMFERERLERLALQALCHLADCLEARGQYEESLHYIWRRVELDPWQEKAHRQLMRLLTLSGRPAAALSRYEACRRLLREGMGIEPAEETTRLYWQIRSGKLSKGMEQPASTEEISTQVVA